MSLLFEFLALFFALQIIFRKLIAPFFQGVNDAKLSKPPVNVSTASLKKIDPKEIQDAEFEEIK